MVALDNGLHGQSPGLDCESGVETSGPRNAIERYCILLLAYACIPGRGSEPGVGWNRAVALAKYFDTWVLCSKSVCAEAVTAHVRRHGRVPGLRFVFVPESRFERLLQRIPGMMYLAYNLWNRRAGRIAKRLHARRQFHLLHHLTLCGFREPGYLWTLDAPFVWGPIGGTQNYPWRFLAKAGPSSALREGVRSVLNWLQLRFSVRVRRAARRASLLMAATTLNQQAFSKAHAVTPVLFSDVGVCERLVIERPQGDAGVLRLLWCGMLEPRKALHLLVEALGHMSHEVAWELHVVGSGPLRGKLERLAAFHGITDRVQWLGEIPHQEVLAEFAWADVFVFTSLRDTTGTVLCEALATGTPIVCLDHQGAADVVDASCGIKIPVTRPRAVVDDLTRAITSLARNPQMRQSLAQGAWRRAEHYLWSEGGERLADMYRRVIAEDKTSGRRPETSSVPPEVGSGMPSSTNNLMSGAVSTISAVSTVCARQVRPGSRLWKALRRRFGPGAEAGLVGLVDQVVVSGVRFLITVFVGRLCGAGELGSYTLAFSLMLAALAIQESLVLNPYIVLTNGLKGVRRDVYLGSTLTEAAIGAGLTLLAFLGAALAMAPRAGGVGPATMLGVLGVVIPFLLLQQFGRRAAFAEFEVYTALFLDVAMAVIQIGGLAALAAWGALSASAIFLLMGLAALVPGAVWLLRKQPFRYVSWPDLPGDMRANWRLGRWMLASQLTSVFGVYVSGWLLAVMLDVAATGVYAACASIVCLTNPILLGLNNVLLPRAAMAHAEGGHPEIRRILRKASSVLVGLTGVATGILFVFGHWLLTLLYGAEFASYHHVLEILALGTLLNASGMAAGQCLAAMERSDVAFVAHLAGVGVACLLGLALVPRFGIVGAAIGPLVGSAITATCLIASHEILTRPRLVAKEVGE